MKDDQMVFVWILIGTIVTLLGVFVLPNIFIWRKNSKGKKIDKKILKYFRTPEFSNIKSMVLQDVIAFNEYNSYLGELKQRIPSLGSHEIKVKKLNKDISRKYLYECDENTINYAKNSSFLCLCEKFDIIPSDITQSKLEEMYNIYLSIEDGIEILKNFRSNIISQISSKIPNYVKEDIDTLYERLHFEPLNNDIYFPKYTFKNNKQTIDVILNKDNLIKFMKFISNNTNNECIMSTNFRTSVLKRDNYTCCKCNANNIIDKNLSLEISLIKPINLGGKIDFNNYETLCWKCSREKALKSGTIIKLTPKQNKIILKLNKKEKTTIKLNLKKEPKKQEKVKIKLNL